MLPGQSQTLPAPVSVAGLPASGGVVCFCVRLYGALENELLCEEMICVDFPPCTPGPGMTLQPVGQILCPTYVGGPFKFTFNITNTQPAPAFGAIVTPCNSGVGGSGPFGASPGTVTFSPPVLGNGGMTIIPGIQLPPSVPEGATFCYLVKIYNQSEQLICEEMHCITLPRCACATVTTSVTCVEPFPNRQVVFNVTNNTNVVGSPFNFTQAVIIPSAGFSPAVMTAVPNPIIPGASGTFTTVFSGYKAPQCVMLLLFNADRSKCCRVKVCPLWVSCDPGPPKDICDHAGEIVSEANGLATQTAWITNNSPTQTKNYSWIVVPAAVPGCTGTLPAGAFTPSGGVVGPIGPGSAQAVAFTINAASLPPGVCAGYRICFTEVSPVNAAEPVCCDGIVRKIRPSDPCIIKNPSGRGIPPLVGDVDIIIKNPTSAVMDLSLPATPGVPREFFKLRSVAPVFGKPE